MQRYGWHELLFQYKPVVSDSEGSQEMAESSQETEESTQEVDSEGTSSQATAETTGVSCPS